MKRHFGANCESSLGRAPGVETLRVFDPEIAFVHASPRVDRMRRDGHREIRQSVRARRLNQTKHGADAKNPYQIRHPTPRLRSNSPGEFGSLFIRGSAPLGIGGAGTNREATNVSSDSRAAAITTLHSSRAPSTSAATARLIGSRGEVARSSAERETNAHLARALRHDL